jgi:hypothetical protein
MRRFRAAADGAEVPDERQVIDDGVSGTTLVRPALERVRDLAAVGGLDRLSVHAPDRLARRYAYQVLLVEELTGAGVEVVFLNRPLGATPEDTPLLRAQGIMAEDERATPREGGGRQGPRPKARDGQGSIYPRFGVRDGRITSWRWPILVEGRATGRRYLRHGSAKTEREARKALTQVAAQMDEHRLPARSAAQGTVADLVARYLAAKRLEASPKTYAKEGQFASLHILPATGGVKQERLKAGGACRGHQLVLATALGAPLMHANLWRSFKGLLKRLGLPGLSPHACRHTAATNMLYAGVPLPEVSAILGHAGVEVTATIYARALPRGGHGAWVVPAGLRGLELLWAWYDTGDAEADRQGPDGGGALHARARG